MLCHEMCGHLEVCVLMGRAVFSKRPVPVEDGETTHSEFKRDNKTECKKVTNELSRHMRTLLLVEFGRKRKENLSLKLSDFHHIFQPKQPTAYSDSLCADLMETGSVQLSQIMKTFGGKNKQSNATSHYFLIEKTTVIWFREDGCFSLKCSFHWYEWVCLLLLQYISTFQ